MALCNNQVEVRRRPDGSAITVRCGKWHNGERVFCAPCEEQDGMSFPNADDYHRVSQADLYPLFR